MYKTICEFLNQLTVDENLEIQDTLNPQLWNENRILNPLVKEKILAIVDEFKNSLTEKEIPLDIKDIIITGSNANYTYNDNSDLDIHILSKFTDEEGYLDKIYNAYKTLFNSKYDITINNIPVEVYVENEDLTDLKSNGIYSVLNSKWIKEPKKETIPEIDEKALQDKIDEWKARYDKIMNGPLDSNDSVKAIDKFFDDIYELRQKGLNKDGEYSIDNQLFKELRNLGIFDSLKDFRIQVLNYTLSL